MALSSWRRRLVARSTPSPSPSASPSASRSSPQARRALSASCAALFVASSSASYHAPSPRLRVSSPSPSSSSSSSSVALHKLRVSVVALLHEALTQARKWPTEPGREDRCPFSLCPSALCLSLSHHGASLCSGLRDVLVARLEAQLSLAQSSGDAAEVAALGARVQADLRALLALLKNASFSAHTLSAYVVPEVVQRHAQLLSTRAQHKIASRRFGWLDRLLSWYLTCAPHRSHLSPLPPDLSPLTSHLSLCRAVTAPPPPPPPRPLSVAAAAARCACSSRSARASASSTRPSGHARRRSPPEPSLVCV